jgi:hypothetical protein
MIEDPSNVEVDPPIDTPPKSDDLPPLPMGLNFIERELFYTQWKLRSYNATIQKVSYLDRTTREAKHRSNR